MRRLFFLIPLVFISGFILSQNITDLTVNISNIELNRGDIFIGLYDNETNFKLKSGAVDSVIFNPKNTISKIVFENIHIGNYAIAVFQDINNNGKLDVREFKIPTEPVGISNYSLSKSKLPPTFKKAQFTLNGDTLIQIGMVPLDVEQKSITNSK